VWDSERRSELYTSLTESNRLDVRPAGMILLVGGSYAVSSAFVSERFIWYQTGSTIDEGPTVRNRIGMLSNINKSDRDYTNTNISPVTLRNDSRSSGWPRTGYYIQDKYRKRYRKQDKKAITAPSNRELRLSQNH